ncbi:MAG TPA: AAA family ATPase, partial [Candidatus Nitrosocosmicus sp.]|nr:AAA family ATPase [Candidatus Nitrosocosmicus sp.]
MLLKQISLTNFRSFSKNIFDINPQLTVIYGNNSVGKTNLLEAIYCIAKGRGFREKEEEELLKNGESTCDIQSICENDNNLITYRIHLSRQNAIVKTCFIDRVKKRTFDYQSLTFPVAIFSPNLVYVIDGDLSERREFFDSIIMMIDKEYKKRLTNYNNSLKRRNKLLEKYDDIKTLKEQLIFWDNYLIAEAEYITEMREKLVTFLNNNPCVQDKSFEIKYLKNEISTKTLEETFQK